MGSKSRYWWKNRFLLGLLVSILLHGSLILLLGRGDQSESLEMAMVENPLRIHFVGGEEGIGTTDSTDQTNGAEGKGTTDSTDHADGEEGRGTTDSTDLADGEEGRGTADSTDHADGAEGRGTTDSTDHADGEEGIFAGADDALDGAASEELFASLTQGLALQKPVYPEVARRWGYEGLVKVEIFVAADGMVSEVLLLESSGYEILDQSVMRTVSRKWAFHPPGRELSIVKSFEFYLE